MNHKVSFTCECNSASYLSCNEELLDDFSVRPSIPTTRERSFTFSSSFNATLSGKFAFKMQFCVQQNFTDLWPSASHLCDWRSTLQNLMLHLDVFSSLWFRNQWFIVYSQAINSGNDRRHSRGVGYKQPVIDILLLATDGITRQKGIFDFFYSPKFVFGFFFLSNFYVFYAAQKK